jgi:uncharacterized protein
MTALDPFLLDVIACPGCHGRLEAGAEALRCSVCRLEFPVVDGIPVLLLTDARPLSEGGDA